MAADGNAVANPLASGNGSGGSPFVKADLMETLAQMQYRKVFRYHRGHYVAVKPMRLLLLLFFMGILTLFDTITVTALPDGGRIISFSLVDSNNPTPSLQSISMILLIITVFIQMKLLGLYSLRWLTTMATVAVLLQFSWVVYEFTEKLETMSLPCGADQAGVEGKAIYHLQFPHTVGMADTLNSLITFIYVLVSYTYILYVAVARSLMPYLTKYNYFLPVLQHPADFEATSRTGTALRPVTGRRGAYAPSAGRCFVCVAPLLEVEYLAPEWPTEDNPTTADAAYFYKAPFFWHTTRWICKYSGEVNKAGKPDGYGVWSDSHPQGETLEGYWENGLPIGPFRARETGSGSGFVQIRVGFFTCREEDTNTIKCIPGMAPYSIGVAAVECCVSGAFFHEHPKAKVQWEDTDLNPGNELDDKCKKMLGEMKTLAGATKEPASIHIYADSTHGITVSGFVREPRTLESTLTISVPRVGAAAETSGPSMDSYSSVPLGPPPGEDLSESGSPRLSECASKRKSHFHSVKRGLMRQVTHKMFERVQYQQKLQLEGWHAQEGLGGCEVLIHIHGYNSACIHGAKNIAQLWTFSNFPPHIKPIVFSWPTGKLLAYSAAQTKGAENDDVAKALRQLIISLAAAGVRDFHFQTHSMGARMLMHALPNIMDLFERPMHTTLNPVHSGFEADSPAERYPDVEQCEFSHSLKMVNVILMNPEYGLHQFVKTRADILDRICDITTVYGDLKDAALFFSYAMNNIQSSMMKHHRKSWLPTEVTASQPCRGIWKQRDTCLGLHIYDVNDDDGNPVRVDMIDCTFLESNVQAGRHNTFTLNRSVIEDLHDVVVNRRPAMQRFNRLEARGGNVYSFLVAPSHVVAP